MCEAGSAKRGALGPKSRSTASDNKERKLTFSPQPTSGKQLQQAAPTSRLLITPVLRNAHNPNDKPSLRKRRRRQQAHPSKLRVREVWHIGECRRDRWGKHTAPWCSHHSGGRKSSQQAGPGEPPCPQGNQATYQGSSAALVAVHKNTNLVALRSCPANPQAGQQPHYAAPEPL